MRSVELLVVISIIMDNNITVTSGHEFKMNYSDEKGSVRTDSASTLGNQRRCRIMHADYTDTNTKVSGRRHVCRFERDVTDPITGKPAMVVMQLVAQIPTTSAISSSDVTSELSYLTSFLATAGVPSAILVNEEQ